jgi:hypothetical protein
MNRQYVDQIIAEDRGASTYGAVKAAVITGIDARLKAAKDALAWNQLDATDSQAMRAGQSIHVFRGSEYSGQQFGLMIRALPGSQDETGTPLRIEIISKLLDSSANPSIEEIKVPVPDAYVLPKGGAVLISGALPRRALQPVETRLYGTAEIFRVFRSENYRAGFSEFVILIESK